MLKKFILTVIICFCAVFFQGCFYLKQGAYLLNYYSHARSTKKMVKDPNTSSDLKEFFNLVEHIRSFATDSIGLVENKNYTRYIKVKKDYIADFVNASEKLSFKQYKWCFPIVGCMQYKGFFLREDAEKEAKKISEKGYDVNVNQADAFSTLGFFSDPLYSFMAKYSPYSLGSLIFHEQTHATIYIKNQVQFNEELASFIGKEGGLLFVKSKYGESSEQYRNAILTNQDNDTFYSLMRKLVAQLDSLYSLKIEDTVKLQKKQAVFDAFRENVTVHYDSIFVTKRFKGISKMTLNNASIDIWMTYTRDLQIFYDLYKKNNYNLKTMINSLKQLKKFKGDPKVRIKEMLLD